MSGGESPRGKEKGRPLTGSFRGAELGQHPEGDTDPG